MGNFLNPEGDFTDDELQQLMALGVIPDKQTSLDRQIATAEALRYGNMPEMRGNSRVQTAANPLEFLASGVESVQAGKELKRLREKQDQLLQQTIDARKTFYERMTGNPSPSNRPQRPTPPGIRAPITQDDGSELY